MNGLCKVINCHSRICYNGGHFGGYCNKHYVQMRRFNKFLKLTEKDKNKIIEHDNYCEICLYQRNGAGNEPKEVARGLVDKDDIEKVRKFKWGLSGKIGNKNNHSYVTSRINGRITYLHTLILGKRKNYEIDHKDRNPLNNRKENLRFATRSQNIINRNKLQGVGWNKSLKKWSSRIKSSGKEINLGYYKTKKAARIIRKRVEKKYFGEYSPNNNSKSVVGLTFGCFDFFHRGHKNLLRNAKKYCDVLIVCISDNGYMLKHKKKKAVWLLNKRKQVVFLNKYVDAVDVQSLKFCKRDAIKKYNPDILFVGSDHLSDYSGEGLGIPVKFLPHTPGISSTLLREKMNK